MVVVGKRFAFLLIVVQGEIPTELQQFEFLLPFQRQPGMVEKNGTGITPPPPPHPPPSPSPSPPPSPPLDV